MAEAYPRPMDAESVSSSDNEEDWLNGNELDDDDDGGEQEAVSVVSLFDDRVFPDAPAMLAYCRDRFGFDFVAVRDRLGLDFHGCVKLINFGAFFLGILFHPFLLVCFPSQDQTQE